MLHKYLSLKKQNKELFNHLVFNKHVFKEEKQETPQEKKTPTQLSMFNEEDFNEKLANFADLQPFEKQIIDENKDEDLDIQCKL